MKPNQEIINHRLIEKDPALEGFKIISRQSTSVEFVGLDFDTNRMFVQFVSGKSYIYPGVDTVILNGCHNCPSIGKYINDFIRPSYNGYPYAYRLVTVLQEGVKE